MITQCRRWICFRWTFVSLKNLFSGRPPSRLLFSQDWHQTNPWMTIERSSHARQAQSETFEWWKQKERACVYVCVCVVRIAPKSSQSDEWHRIGRLYSVLLRCCARGCHAADATKMNNNNGHDNGLGGESGTGQYGSSTSIKQRLGQQPPSSSSSSSRTSSGHHKSAARSTTTVTALATMVTAAPPSQTSPQLPPIRSFEGRRYRDILRQESLSASKENLNGVIPSSKV